MERKLSRKERQELREHHRTERDGRVRDRIKAVLAYDDGHSYSEIATILLFDDETIRRYVDDYFSKNKLAPESGGSISFLTEEESEQLINYLRLNTLRYVKEIRNYVKQTFKKHYSLSGMTKWLINHKFAYKKPHVVPAKFDEERQEEFKRFYEKLKKTEEKEPIYFVDSVHPQHQTRLAYGWILKGERKSIATTARQYRLNFMGGICLNGHQFVYEQAKKIDAESIQLFLKKLRQAHAGGERLHAIWDNAGYHHSKDVVRYAEALNIKIHYLPPYSPNLNPIERLWKIFHEEVTYNKYYEKFSEFTEAAIHFFKTIGRRKTILRSRITDKFQKLTAPNFAS